MLRPRGDGVVILINGRSILLSDDKVEELKLQLEQYLLSKLITPALVKVS